MSNRFFWLICFPLFLLWGADYDCVFIGTSPICLFEALHQHYSGRRVLLIDDADDLGGAWKSISICDIPHVDVGCHQIGSDRSIQEFLQERIGCKLVQMDKPEEPFDPAKPTGNGYYFSRGCFELIEAIKALLAKTTVEIRLRHTVQAAFVDPTEPCVVLTVNGQQVTGGKVFLPSYCSFTFQDSPQLRSKIKFFHLYMLLADSTLPTFSYQNYSGPHASRVMNVTHFAGLNGTGRQLIIFQTYSEADLREGTKLLKDLKAKKLVSPEAYLLKEEPYVYEQWSRSHWRFLKLPAEHKELFEVLDTSHFNSMQRRIKDWKRTFL